LAGSELAAEYSGARLAKSTGTSESLLKPACGGSDADPRAWNPRILTSAAPRLHCAPSSPWPSRKTHPGEPWCNRNGVGRR